MANLTFNVVFATSLEGVTASTSTTTVFAEDLNNCQRCYDLVQNCWPCLSTEQQVFTNQELTNIVQDGFYRFEFGNGHNDGIWHIVGGFPLGAGYQS